MHCGVFTKTLKPLAALLRELGVRIVIYIDDVLLLAESEMGDRPNGQMEREIVGGQRNLPDNRLRCLSPGMGCSVQSPEDRRSVVKLGMSNAYQLSGASGGHVSCPNVCKTQTRNTTILVRLDNTTAVLYINAMDRTISLVLTDLANTLWLWCLDQGIQLRAQHIAG